MIFYHNMRNVGMLQILYNPFRTS